MVNDWLETTLGEVILTNHQSYSKNDNWSFINYLDTGNITENNISDVQYLEVGIDKIPSRAKRKVDSGDIIYSTVRPNQKHFGVIRNPLDNMLVSTGFTTIRCKSAEADTNFIYWFLVQPQIIEHLQSIGEQSASAYPSIKPSDIESLDIQLPPIEEQKAIAHILGSLDNKIELNRQMNETLEAMAQALFKSWFVDFDPVIDNALAAGNAIPDEFAGRAEQRKSIKKKDNSDIQALFPDEFEFTEDMGWIPKGWGIKKISDLVESVSITYPLKTVNEVIFLNTGDILAGKFLHKNYSDASSLPGQAKKSIKRDDILYSEIRPKNKRYAYVNFEADDYVVSTKLMVLRAVSSVKSLFSYFYLKQESVVLDLQYMAEDRSGTFPQITFDVLSQLTLTLPNETVLVNYFTDQILVPYHNKIYKNEESSENLAKLRDTLLPKLMSGELRIPDADAMTKEV